MLAEGLTVSLVNSNPATIMTDPEYADYTYVEPITPAFVEKVIAQQAAAAIRSTRCCPHWAVRPHSTPPSRSTRTGPWSVTTSNSSVPTLRPSNAARTASSSRTSWPKSGRVGQVQGVFHHGRGP